MTSPSSKTSTSDPQLARAANPFLDGCAILRGEDCGNFSISGKDAKDFLHRMTSNEIRNLSEGQGAPTCLLNTKGRVELYFYLWNFGSEYRAHVWGKQREEFFAKMERYHFAEQMEIADRSAEEGVLLLAGPKSQEVLEASFGNLIPSLEPNQSTLVEAPDGAVRIHRLDWLPVSTFLLTALRNELEIARSSLLSEGAVDGNWDSFHTLRMEQGTPWPEFEIDDSMIPYECGLDRAVSLTKGCFVGQEIVARMHNLGESPRYLRGLVFESDQVPPRGAEVLAGEVKAGKILTSGYSARLGGAVATTSILRKSSEAGTAVEVEGEKAEVREFPIE